MARRLLTAFRVPQPAIETPRPRAGIVVLLTALIALAGAVSWVVDKECGCRETSRADRVRAEVHELAQNARQHDAWGNPYMFVCNAHTITVVSAGEDGQFMTADDIRSDR